MALMLFLLLLLPQQENPKDLQAVVETTSGTFILQFHADEAPNHVRKFLELARQGRELGVKRWKQFGGPRP